MLVIAFLLFAAAGAASLEGLAETTNVSSRITYYTFPEFGDMSVYAINVTNATEALKMFMDKCQRNETNFNQAKYASSELTDCVLSHINGTRLMQLQSQGIQRIGSTFCNMGHAVLDCGEKFLSSVTPCLDDVEKESKQILLNISKYLTNLLCSDSIFSQATDVYSGMECLSKNHATFEKCLLQLSLFEFPEDVKIVRILPDLTGSKEKCSNLKNSASCFQEAISKCPASFFGGILQKIVDIVFTEMCSKYN
ncbi:uncharacterized protein LOC134530918 [Bacillus rossius redtenbacheri]|uniref:uncharacterized protein LOC134530918 n=1 Tax=Bacillus rossius redtenbacheri TaxID=93214 RepID=UPI002FDCFE08